MAAPTLESTLNRFLQPTNLNEELRYRPLIRSLSEADRAHLARWLKDARDPVWEQLAAATRQRGKLRAYVEDPYSYFIDSALRARQFAESQIDTPDLQRKRKQQREQEERRDLLVLADEMDRMVRNYLACRNAQYPQPVPSPSGVPLSPPPREAEGKRALEWFKREAQRLRQLAKRVSADEPETVRVSRQRGGKGKRAQSRELSVFMQKMVTCMCQLCGKRKPHHHAVAAMTNIAFPDADVVGEDVRSACRPTTRTARRKRCTQSPK
jgi:hypothetical protein